MKAFLPNGIKGLLDVDEKLLWGPFRPDRDVQLHLVGQCQLERVGA